MSERFIIDTDTASDDAVALIMALMWPAVAVEAITVVAGNVSLAQGSRNARTVVELCGADVPVYEGGDRPLLRKPHDAHYFHGPDGLGGLNCPAPQRAAEPAHAVDELVRRFGEAPGQLTLVTLGPLTNVAAALRREPRLAGWVKQAYVMAGAACTVGNVTPAAEYNVWCDPEAAQIVFSSGMKLLMVGWEHCCGEAGLDDAERKKVLDFGTQRARFAIECNRTALEASRRLHHDRGLELPDPVTMSIALDPSVCTRRSAHYVEVSCDERLTRGMTVVDRLGVTQQPPNVLGVPADAARVEVCWAIDAARWKEVLYQTLR